MATELDDLSLVTFLEEVHEFKILAVKRTGLGREVYTVDRDITGELIQEFQTSAWLESRNRFKPPGHTG